MIRALAGLVVLAGAAQAQPVAAPSLAVRIGGIDAPAGAPRSSASRDSTALPDDWLARDKAMHAGASFLLTLSGQYVLTDKAGVSDGRAVPVAAGSALALGLLKEVADARRPRDPHFCWRDLAADAAGVALAVALIEW